MSEFNVKEINNEEIQYSMEDTIEVAIMSKVKQFFELNKKLRKNQLNIFLESINLSDVFGEDEEKEIIWNIFSRLSLNSTEIDYETCQIGMKELFLFYGIAGDETENNSDSYNKHDNLYEFNANSNNQVTHFCTTPFRTTLINSRESLNNKDKKLDELLLRISIKNTPDRFQKFNTPYLDSELPHRKDSIEYTKTNGFDLQLSINQVNDPKITQSKRTHERKITKTFTEIDIEKLQQLRKVFTLLDLRNKENVYISDIQEVISKYKFIKLTSDELVNFLRLISDDIIKSGENKSQKFSINFELYSRAIAAIEKQLLQVNSDTFEEKSDSFELKDNYMELIDELNGMETETVEHIMVLADIIKSSHIRVEEDLCENYEKLISKKFSGKENESGIKIMIKEDLQAFHNKIKDAQLFLKEINEASVKKQNKLSSLKIVISKLENNLKNAEEDYRSMFEKFNMNQPVEIDDETEKLFEENSCLNEQNLSKENKILELQKELNERIEQIFNLSNLLEKSKSIENENKTSYANLKKEFEILENNYNFLIEDIYEKIDKEDKKEIANSGNKNSAKKAFNHDLKEVKDIENFKIKEKLGKNDLTKKIVEMNYDQLLIYTVNTESLNAQLEEKNKQKDGRIKGIEKELNEVKNVAIEDSKIVRQLKTENIRLQEKINEMNKEIEINNMFRPSRVLNNRMSRISKIGDNKDRFSNASSNTSMISNNKAPNAGRFNKMQKLFELDAKQKEASKMSNNLENDEASFSNSRISKIEFTDEMTNQINLDCNDLKLKIETQAGINTINIAKKNSVIDKQNRITYESSDSCFNNHFTFNNFPSKPTESNNNTINRVSNNYALEDSTFTNGNIEIFSQADPFASNDKFIFDEKVDIGSKDPAIKTKERTTRVKYSFRPEDDYYLDNNDEGMVETVGHNIIMDYLDENPFSSKNNDDDNAEKLRVEDELDTSVNWNKIAKHSLIEVDMHEIKKNREKLKQSLTRQNTVESTTTATFSSKLNKRLPSLITEEILEEDINGDIIGTPSKTDKKSIENSSSKKSIGTSGTRLGSEDNFKGNHTRMNTMDLDLVFNKDSQYVCYDFLTLRKNMGIISMLENNSEDVSSYEMFSDNVFLIDEYNKKSKKYLFITSNSIYILRPYDVTSKIRVSLKHLNKLTISNKNCNLIAIHFSEGNDLLLEILRRTELLYYFRDLYRMKGFGKLKFKYSDNFQIKRNNVISNIIVNQPNNFFIAPNFENAQKLGYLFKLSGRFFTNFNEKLVVLTNVGLLYFDDPNKPPKMLIPIIGSEISKIDEKKYKRKYCFEIKTLNGECYVFGTKADEELDSWINEFKNFKKSYEKKMKNIDNNSK